MVEINTVNKDKRALLFELSGDELSNYGKWATSHNCDLTENSGAIGGRLTYSFTPTGLGMIVKVKCGCGEEIDLTNTDNW